MIEQQGHTQGPAKQSQSMIPPPRLTAHMEFFLSDCDSLGLLSGLGKVVMHPGNLYLRTVV